MKREEKTGIFQGKPFLVIEDGSGNKLSRLLFVIKNIKEVLNYFLYATLIHQKVCGVFECVEI